MLALAWRMVRFHWDGQRSNPANLAAAVLGMALNNCLFLAGMWVMLFAGKRDNDRLLVYFLAVQAIVTLAWGILNFFAFGFRALGEMVDDGSFEVFLAAPRPALFLAGFSRTSAVALGDVIQGALALLAVGWLGGPAWLIRAGVAAGIAVLAFAGVYIAAGAVPFFFARGAALGHLIVECTLSLSLYPLGKILDAPARYFLYLTPALAVSLLPMEMVERASFAWFLAALAAAGALFAGAVGLFSLGARRFRAASFIGARQ